MSDDRYQSKTLLMQGDSGPEPMSVPGVVVLAPLQGARTGVSRTPAEVATALPSDEAELESYLASNIEEACERHGIRITGNYTDADANVRTVNLEVRGERDFTPTGLVEGDAGLRSIYLESCICDASANEFERSGRGPMTAEEKAVIAELAEQLERMADEEAAS